MDYLFTSLQCLTSRKSKTNCKTNKTAAKIISHLLHSKSKPIHQTNDNKCINYEEVVDCVNYLQCRTSVKPKIGIICGSGLGGLADLITDAQMFSYKDIPHFPVSTVAGHAGALVFGKLENVPVVCMKGRIHAYEGYSLSKCTLPIRVFKLLGVETMIITNAAGGLNEKFNVGDIMIIKDHIFFPGFAGNNPLCGPNDERFGRRFPAMNDCYRKKLIQIAEDTAAKIGITQYVHKGVYGMNGGPNFETVAEARFLKYCGVDAAGMSTVHETIVAHHSGMQVLGFSLITNKIISEYDSDEIVDHDSVLEASKKRAKDFEQLIMEIIPKIANT